MNRVGLRIAGRVVYCMLFSFIVSQRVMAWPCNPPACPDCETCTPTGCECLAQCCSDNDCGSPACWNCTANCQCECDITINSISSDKDTTCIGCDVEFTASVTGSCSCVNWSGGGDPTTAEGTCSFTTHWDSPGTKTVTAVPKCGNSKSKQVNVVCPAGETTQFDSWSGPAAGFKSQLIPADADFSCLSVRDKDGTGSEDHCWFAGSERPKFESLTGGTWSVGANNWWGNDWLSWGDQDITYYRAHPDANNPRAPCCTNLAQIMEVVEGYCGDYASGTLDIWINVTTVAASRNMAMAAKPYP